MLDAGHIAQPRLLWKIFLMPSTSTPPFVQYAERREHAYQSVSHVSSHAKLVPAVVAVHDHGVCVMLRGLSRNSRSNSRVKKLSEIAADVPKTPRPNPSFEMYLANRATIDTSDYQLRLPTALILNKVHFSRNKGASASASSSHFHNSASAGHSPKIYASGSHNCGIV